MNPMGGDQADPSGRSPPEGMDPRMMGGYQGYPPGFAAGGGPGGQYGGQPYPPGSSPGGGHGYHPGMQPASYGQQQPQHPGAQQVGGSGMPFVNPMFAAGGAAGGGGYAGYGGPRGQPSWYGYNPATGFPTAAQQQQMAAEQMSGPQSSRSTRGGRAPPTKLPYSPPRLRDKMGENTPNKQDSDEKKPEPTKKMDDLEAERLKNSEAAELSLSEVKPIQTDYHFFVADVRERLRSEAEAELAASTKEGEEIDQYLLNTNLNSRIKKAWEDLKEDEREIYVQKEEQDRRRFQEEDEVASRHCFTLTARLRSDTKKGDSSPDKESADKVIEDSKLPGEGKGEGEAAKVEESRTSPGQEHKRRPEEGESTEESPPKKTKEDPP